MREEMIKFDRYQKQFKFLFSHDIETGEQLQKYQQSKEAEIDILITQRKKLYDDKTSENCDEVKEKAKAINTELNELGRKSECAKPFLKTHIKLLRKTAGYGFAGTGR